MNQVIAYYDQIDEDSRFTRKSRRVEYLTTLHVLDPLLPADARILEVGAGGGAYSFTYAGRGHEVTAVDLTPKHIELIQAKSQETGIPLTAEVGNALNLSRYGEGTFDAVLCLGPMYHLTAEEDRDQCIEECLRVLKPGGVLAIAYIGKFSVMPMLASRQREFLREDVIRQVLDRGMTRAGEETCFWTDACFLSPQEMENMLARYEVVEVDHAGTDSICHTIQDAIDGMTEEEYGTWLSYHYETCREPSIRGMSTHGLYVCCKA
ncbi:class I SAM-dependent methyltransferase [Gorillibacterium sp. CAU 1737]|uniref:class I SAM-dependent methyltransferase n=1 Tax=Gorillibacterium sp. CAU 1737 TaxID=3140362 RepID=UPI00326010CE